MRDQDTVIVIILRPSGGQQGADKQLSPHPKNGHSSSAPKLGPWEKWLRWICDVALLAADAMIYAEAQFKDGLYSIQEVADEMVDLRYFSHAVHVEAV